jgi:hypothetical protein
MEWVIITLQPLCHQKWTAVPLESEIGWSPGPVLKFWEEKDLLPLPGLGGRLTRPSWKIAVKIDVGKSTCHDGTKEQTGYHWQTNSELSDGLKKGTELCQIGRIVQDLLTHRNTIIITNAQIKVRCIDPRFYYCQHYRSLMYMKRDSVCQHSDSGSWITNFRLVAEICLAAISVGGECVESLRTYCLPAIQTGSEPFYLLCPTWNGTVTSW